MDWSSGFMNTNRDRNHLALVAEIYPDRAYKTQITDHIIATHSPSIKETINLPGMRVYIEYVVVIFHKSRSAGRSKVITIRNWTNRIVTCTKKKNKMIIRHGILMSTPDYSYCGSR